MLGDLLYQHYPLPRKITSLLLQSGQLSALRKRLLLRMRGRWPALRYGCHKTGLSLNVYSEQPVLQAFSHIPTP